jgi:hypothetical protein
MNNKKMLIASGLSNRNQQESESDDFDKVHEMLEKEKQNNKMDSWNKIDKMMKVRKLNAYADRYGREHNLSIQEIKSLKAFFVQCLDTSRLQKSKEVVYDRETQEIKEIPSLYLHPMQRNFTLRIIDNKRVSTLKALAPRRKKTATTECEEQRKGNQDQRDQDQRDQDQRDQDQREEEQEIESRI